MYWAYRINNLRKGKCESEELESEKLESEKLERENLKEKSVSGKRNRTAEGIDMYGRTEK